MRRILSGILLASLCAGGGAAQKLGVAAPDPSGVGAREGLRAGVPGRPVATYSIVARDPETGELGVAVQSHWFSVGSIVSWAEAGVGVVATQSFVEPSYGPKGLAMMRMGIPAPDALAALLAQDAGREVRQVAFLDAEGRVGVHTGSKCIAAAGHRTGVHYSVQANLMDKPTVWEAMAQAFEQTRGDLAARMLAALEAAEAEGGDIRGRQSAAMVIVKAKSTGRPWADRVIDLRIEDHPDPLGELRRLVRVNRAYNHMNAGDLCAERRDWDCASREYAAAETLLPEMTEITFWHAVTLVTGGRVEPALPLFRKVFAREPKWVELVGRLPAAGLLPEDDALLARIRAQAGK
ncbi:MAG: DUF1028 domain-containing protein [Firmicutes bacterium]|nr:DUF1028 domain-containing protein [Bacillota bacterium]